MNIINKKKNHMLSDYYLVVIILNNYIPWFTISSKLIKIIQFLSKLLITNKFLIKFDQRPSIVSTNISF